MRTIATLSLAGLVALGLVACGGDDDDGGGQAVSAEAWATGVCTGLGSWVTGIQSNVERLTTALGDSADPATAKDEIVQLMDESGQLTTTMLSTIERVGSPDVDRGDEISQALVDGLQPLEQVFADLKTEAEALPADDPQAFVEAASTLEANVTDAFTTFGESFGSVMEEYQSDELKQAFDAADACAALG